jgi:hypothetical protein
MTANALAEIERDIQSARERVELGHALERLKHNPDFQKVVVKGYLEQEAIRLVHLKADPAMDSPANQAAIDRLINSIGAFAQYLHVMGRQATQAVGALADAEETRAEMLEEGASL